MTSRYNCCFIFAYVVPKSRGVNSKYSCGSGSLTCPIEYNFFLLRCTLQSLEGLLNKNKSGKFFLPSLRIPCFFQHLVHCIVASFQRNLRSFAKNYKQDREKLFSCFLLANYVNKNRKYYFSMKSMLIMHGIRI
jgi:hypothetical protein